MLLQDIVPFFSGLPLSCILKYQKKKKKANLSISFFERKSLKKARIYDRIEQIMKEWDFYIL
ncbi:MAG: hypothetical protein U0I48_04090 [Acutalibacteraceae bacterium]|nr:hypothetical protein [Acutalibacteraceae bacterium]